MFPRSRSQRVWPAWLALSAMLLSGLPDGPGSRAMADCCDIENSTPICCDVVVIEPVSCGLTPAAGCTASVSVPLDLGIDINDDSGAIAGPCCPCCIVPPEPLPPTRPTRDTERLPVTSLPHFSYPEWPSTDAGPESRPRPAPSWTPPYRLTMRFLC